MLEAVYEPIACSLLDSQSPVTHHCSFALIFYFWNVSAADEVGFVSYHVFELNLADALDK